MLVEALTLRLRGSLLHPRTQRDALAELRLPAEPGSYLLAACGTNGAPGSGVPQKTKPNACGVQHREGRAERQVRAGAERQVRAGAERQVRAGQ